MAGLKRRLQQLIEWLTATSDSPSRGIRKTVLVGDLDEDRLFSVYSLLGEFEGPDSTFVRHSALMADDCSLPATIPVLHMGPPLVSAVNDHRVAVEDRELQPDLVFSLPLDEPQKAKIARWATRIANEDGPLGKRRYVICPAVKPEKSERGRTKYHRFNCAGYAFEAFRQVEIALCDCQTLPGADEDVLNAVYNELSAIMSRPKLRKYYGIEREPPWPVLLPGYLFHGAELYAERDGPAFEVAHIGYANYPADRSPN